MNCSACTVEIAPPLATVSLLRPAELPRGTADLHDELARVMTALRLDSRVRVIVLTGTGDEFYVPAATEFYRSDAAYDYLVDPAGAAQTIAAIARLHEAMALMETPIVCRLNGDAVSLGASLMFASDFVVAVDGARVRDSHLARRAGAQVGAGAGVVPGDGGGTLATFYLPRALAREFLMLGREFDAAELVRLGVIGRSVPRAELDPSVDEVVRGLLAVPASSLGWTKRVINAPVAAALTSRGDASTAFEFLAFAHRAIAERHVRLTTRRE